MAFFKVRFPGISQDQQEILIAQLSELDYTGFQQLDNELFAYIDEKKFQAQQVDELTAKYELSFSKETIPDQNWNALWESNFEPVVIDNFLAVTTDFHKKIPGVSYEIRITPKMSFGTGHHATTSLVMSEMRELDFKGKTVLDFGTGTGILAILAEKLGAARVTAIDNDDWSINNALENFEKNGSENIVLKKQDSAEGEDLYGIILANINRNVILENIVFLNKQMEEAGELLLSGLLEADVELISDAAVEQGLKLRKKISKDGWILLRFSH